MKIQDLDKPKTKSRELADALRGLEKVVIKYGGVCGCGKSFKKGSVRSISNHPGGVYMEGSKKTQWIYFHCSKCRYDSAFWKVAQKIEARHPEFKQFRAEAAAYIRG